MATTSDPQLHGQQESTAPTSDNGLVQIELLPKEAAGQTHHYQRAQVKPFLTSEKKTTTILFGHLTERHEAMIQAVFQNSGYLCEPLPKPAQSTYQIGKEYCNNGLCNPAYFTAGSLVEYLQELESQGKTRDEIVRDYCYFTASGCGPCRFGMYESEYQRALESAGYHGFRVLTFQSNKGVYQKEKTGIEYTVDFGLGMFLSLHLGDVLYQLPYAIRPYEVNPGETDRVIDEATRDIAEFLRTRKHWDVSEDAAGWVQKLTSKKSVRKWTNVWGKFYRHCFGDDFKALLEKWAARINDIEVDMLRAKPRVKVIGEFYSGIAEGACNFDMFRFLEGEGAQAAVDPIASLVLYWIYQPKLNSIRRRGLDVPYPDASKFAIRKRLANWMSYRKKEWLLSFADFMWAWQYHRVADRMGGRVLGHLIPQEKLDKLAKPFYNPLLRGGEGHLEVGKAIYYATEQKAHMILSLKPFGCMPSTQSDGVQAAVMSAYPDMLFLPIETSGEGEINALSRFQMVLAEARRKCKREFETALSESGYTLEEIREYVASNRDLRRPMNELRKRKGIVGTAAAFATNVAKQMRAEGVQSRRRAA
jgi:predicted nucleotide-binding protein (sugar kinase/HSP70/actin superfamily)